MVRIGITLDLTRSDESAQLTQKFAYIQALVQAGAVPVLIPPIGDGPVLQGLIRSCDGFCFPGGDDVNPAIYGEAAHSLTEPIGDDVEAVEMLVMRHAIAEEIPFLAICRGMQLLNVVQGGTLFQDLQALSITEVTHVHRPLTELWHDISVSPNSRLFHLLGAAEVRTNSSHHQSINRLGQGLTVTAVARDGVIEGVELAGHAFGIGVQFHPETLVDGYSWALGLFKGLVDEVKEGSAVEAREFAHS